MAKSSRSLFDSCSGTEWWSASAQPAPFVRPLLQLVGNTPLADLRTRRERLARASAGLEISPPGAPGDSPAGRHPLDVLPRVIPPAEWELIRQGVLQRARAFNLFIRDIYSEQHILRNRTIPHPVVLRDPTFLREMCGLALPQRDLITFGAFDLTRSPEGEWLVLENHLSLPFGAGYALQNRRLLRQIFPEVFESLHPQPVSAFSTRLVEALRSLSPEKEPHIVLLHDVEPGDEYFEESFLARRMGVAMAKPADLLVRDSQVFLKTIGGLEKVDVLYRRVRSTSLDPVAFGSTHMSGIPGLMSCLRRGSVVVANAPGSGVADNKALLRHADALIRFYLREEPLLRSVPTFNCGDPDQADHVRLHRRELVLKPTQSFDAVRHYCHHILRLQGIDSVERLFEIHPQFVVAQPARILGRCIHFNGSRFAPKSFILRTFFLSGDTPEVMPGGFSFHPGEQDAARQGLCKDTWIPAASRRAAGAAAAHRDEPPATTREYRMVSRTAESVYWMGRYLERAENTARMLTVLESVRWEELGQSAQESFWPLWQAVAEATGQTRFSGLDKPPRNLNDLTRDLVTNRNDPASLVSCLAAARTNALLIREYLAPEVWSCLFQFWESLDSALHTVGHDRAALQEILQRAVDESARFHGTMDRNMPRDDGWFFYRAGLLMERALGTNTILGHVLGRCILTSSDPREEDPDLTALLRLLGSLDAYRREFRARAQIGLVARLLWQNTETPSSLAFCCQELLRVFSEVDRLVHTPSSAQVVRRTEALALHLASLPLDRMFPRTAHETELTSATRGPALLTFKNRFERESARLAGEFSALHQTLEDTFLNHQITLAPAPA